MSEEHRRHVMRHMDGNKTTPPSNPQLTIANSTRGVLDEPTAEERELVKRRLVEKSKGKGKYAGAFAKLCDAVCGATRMAKSLPAAEPLRAESIRMNDFSQADVIRGLKETPVSAPSLIKSIKHAMDKLAKSLGVDSPLGSTSLEAGYGSDSASLTGGSALREQSLDGRLQSTVVPTIVKPKPVTPAAIEKAAAAAMKAGAITGAECNSIATYLAMGKAVPDELMSKLRGGESA